MLPLINAHLRVAFACSDLQNQLLPVGGEKKKQSINEAEPKRKDMNRSKSEEGREYRKGQREEDELWRLRIDQFAIAILFKSFPL